RRSAQRTDENKTSRRQCLKQRPSRCLVIIVDFDQNKVGALVFVGLGFKDAQSLDVPKTGEFAPQQVAQQRRNAHQDELFWSGRGGVRFTHGLIFNGRLLVSVRA